MSVRTRMASRPMRSMSAHGMVRVSSRPSSPKSRGRPSRSKLPMRAVSASNSTSSTRPRQAPSFSWTTSLLHSSRKVISPAPLQSHPMPVRAGRCKRAGKYCPGCAILGAVRSQLFLKRYHRCIKISCSTSAASWWISTPTSTSSTCSGTGGWKRRSTT